MKLPYKGLSRSILSLAILSGLLILQWRRRAVNSIAFYATDRQYLCNALINVARLQILGSRTRITVLLPDTFLRARAGTPTSRLVDALRKREVVLVGLDMHQLGLSVDDVTYKHSLLKLEILRLSYKRLLYFDNDGLILQNPDHLFAVDTTSELTMPLAYYVQQSTGAEPLYSSALMLLRPSLKLYEKAMVLVKRRAESDFDMEIFNQLMRDQTVSMSTLPYRQNLLLTGLFRNHTIYTSSDQWNATKEYEAARYIHFSDAPIPKPWIDDRGASFASHGPKCPRGGIECDEVRIWREVYNAFRDEMRELCPSPKELDP